MLLGPRQGPLLLWVLPPPSCVQWGTGQAEGCGAHTSILALRTQTESSLPSLPTSTFMMPFQLSPVETWKSVRKAMPKFSKVACRLMPSHGFSSLQTRGQRRPAVQLHGPLHNPHGLLSESPLQPWEVRVDCAQPTDGGTEAPGGGWHTSWGSDSGSLAPPPTQVAVPEGEDGVGERRPSRKPCFLEPTLYCLRPALWRLRLQGWHWPRTDTGLWGQRRRPWRSDSWGGLQVGAHSIGLGCAGGPKLACFKSSLSHRRGEGWLRAAHLPPRAYCGGISPIQRQTLMWHSRGVSGLPPPKTLF